MKKNKFIKTDKKNHRRIDLNEVVYYERNDYNGFQIQFKLQNISNTVSWNFSKAEERDAMMEKLDIAAECQDISIIVTL